MKTTPEALKALYAALGGTASDVADLDKTVDLLNALAALCGSSDTAHRIPDAIDLITAQSANITISD